MKTVFFLSATLCGGPLALSAHGPGRSLPAVSGAADLTDLVGGLAQLGLFSLFTGVVAMGAVWAIYLWKACAGLKKPRRNAPRQLAAMLALMSGLAFMGSGCSAAKWAVATTVPAVPAAREGCPWPHQHLANPPGPGAASIDNARWFEPAFCRFCGQRIIRRAF